MLSRVEHEKCLINLGPGNKFNSLEKNNASSLFLIKDKGPFEPRHEKTCLWGRQSGPTQTRQYNQRTWLEA